MDIQFRHIPMNRLVLSPHNPRKTPASPEEDASLLASIARRGIIIPLIVETFDPPNGHIGVVAGGRRLAAMQQCAADQKVPADHPILCCTSADGIDPAEIAYIENCMRAAMHPADQFEVFAKFAAEGVALEEIADRFGTSVRTVERRLSLAKVDPSLLDAYRGGEMNLDTLMAFTLTTDHELQRKVWKAAQNQPSYYLGAHHARFVRRNLTEKRITGDDRIARFVGIDAYQAAGGAVTHDLFAEKESEVWFDDPELANSVATQRLEDRGAKLRDDDWSWVETTLEPTDYLNLDAYGRYQPKPTEAEATRLKEIHDRIMAVHNDDSISNEDRDTTVQGLRKESTRIERKVSRRTIPKSYRQKSGCIVGIDMHGNLSIVRGLIRPEEMPKEPADDNTDNVSVSGTSRTRTSSTPRATKPPKCYSEGHAAVMRSLRTILLQTYLAANPKIAYDIVLYEFARQLLPGCIADDWSVPKALDITVRPTKPQVRPDRDASFAAASADQIALLDAAGAALPVEILQNAPDDQAFRLLSALPQAQKDAILAYCAARLPCHQLSFDTDRSGALEAAIELLDIDPAVFRPTAKTFWNRLPKNRILDIATEVIGEPWARSHAGDRKSDLAMHMELVFADPANDPDVPAQAYERIRAWSMPGFAPFAPDPVALEAPAEASQAPSGDTEPGTDADGSLDDADSDDDAELPEFLNA